MDGADVILAIVVATALAFDFTNGFHDTANVVATTISTRALPPRVAVTLAAILNFVGAFLSLAVAATIANDIVDQALVTTTIVFAGLVGAIVWNLVTWYFGLPSSSSHALIGGVVGAMLVANGTDGDQLRRPRRQGARPGADRARARVRRRRDRDPRLLPRSSGGSRPGPVSRGYRLGQVLSGGMLALAHGTNDAQKTMGVITLALIANGNLGADAAVPTWVIVSAATAIALGTYLGGWRIIKTMGSRIIKMDPAQGFAAQGSGAAVILAATHFGYPLSTTHTISGAVMGAGAAKRLSAVRWGVAGNIVVAWVLTLPAAALVGGARLRRHARSSATAPPGR